MTKDKDFETLRADLRGALILPGNAPYDDARVVWNAMIDRRPRAIVRCAGVADVMAGVGFVAEHDLTVSIRGGGHNVAGAAVCEDGLMLDLSGMRAVRVDPGRCVASVEGGATLADLDHATQAFGLAVPGGEVSSTGVGGLTLGGGFGWLSRLYGLAIDNLLSVDMVTADGAFLRASADENVELFWALRGGGGNFGVAVAFEFQLRTVGPDVLFGPTLYRIEDAPDVLHHYREFCRNAPRVACVWADLMTALPLPFLPERFHGTRAISLMQSYAGDPAEGEAILAPLRGCETPIGDGVTLRPYRLAQQILDNAYDKGARNFWSAQNFADLRDPVPNILADLGASLPTPESDILISQLGGAIGDVAGYATAYPHRKAAFAITPGARWRDPTEDKGCIGWVHHAADALAPMPTAAPTPTSSASPRGANTPPMATTTIGSRRSRPL